MDKFVVGGLVVAILIAIMAPYLASSDPDGLESAAEKIINPEVSDEAVLESPMPDYVIPSLGEDPISGVVAIIIGVLVVFGLAYGLGYVLKKKET
ncbi:MAG: PDGLE domain-containing protein [Euryarchaeota archaeon]|nr:PDGLE domain-containing protein [Euryarchaeota archaeon]MBV1730173.1 PDGLE domain-containing protein [Methanobacterium sp.]MBU4547618.1 PDGLE domain-containing protein [Euryarchaeota archaeon]MBU4607885.1 PDGLE domain-containing protein [Euryarchaeota archaeon]MBV1755324.1 PDGLE domain-containing protein [Methanobacterium sp.]